MPNPKGETQFSYQTTNKKGEEITKTLVFKFNNDGRMAVENQLGMEAGEIGAKIGAAGPRITTALFWGATRKHHRREFPNPQAVSNFMDEFEDLKDDAGEEEGREMELDLSVSLLAAWLRQDKQELLDRLNGEVADDDEEEEAPKETKKKADLKSA